MKQILLNKDFFDEGEKIRADFYIEHRELNMHSHEFWEISYVYEGRGTHHLGDGSKIPIKEGEFVFISPGVEHCITSPCIDKGGWVRVCNCLITQAYMDKMKEKFLTMHEFDEYALRRKIVRKEPVGIHLKDDSGSVYNFLYSTAHEYNHFTDGSSLIIENEALNLLVYITRLFERSVRGETIDATNNEGIDDLIKYIKSNLEYNITLDFLAAYMHLSPEYLSRYFKKCTGRNLSQYLTALRIERAKYMLRTSADTISNISMHCGYRSISNFQKAFKKLVGMSAGEYRKTAER